MPLANGQVTINDCPTKSKLYRFCEKKIDQWLRSHSGSGDQTVESVEFRVSFSEETGTKQVSCVAEILLGGATWRGCDLANDTQNAFMHALKRLKPHEAQTQSTDLTTVASTH
jgi:hypothetical protein